MPPAAPSPAQPFDQLPLSFVQNASRTAAALTFLLVLPLLAVLATPVALILSFAAADTAHAIGDKPVAVGVLVLGLALLLAAFLVPTLRLTRKLWHTRSVCVVPDRVTVSETGLFSAKVWSAPLSDFSGIAHHVRTTFSGMRQELVLVHRDRRHTVPLHTADNISHATIERAAALLGLPQLPARELYRVTRAAPPALGSLANAETA
jgi:hypothetical protein